MSIASLFRRTSPLLESELSESVFTPHVQGLDEEAGLIRGVKILGANSQNGRTYSPQAMRDAARLYEGVSVNIDHAETARKHRGLLESWGRIESPVVRADGVYGDLRYLKTHPSTSLLIERIKGDFGMGLSHNANGKTRRKNGRVIVESVAVVRSVDVVAKPATNQNLFESIEDEAMKVTFGEVLKEAAKTAKHGKELLLEMRWDQ